MGFLGNINKGGLAPLINNLGKLLGASPAPQPSPPPPPAQPSWRSDGFGAAPPAPGPLVGHVPREIPRPVNELVPDLDGRLASARDTAGRFSSDLHVMLPLLRHGQLSGSENAQRMWAFFLAYAEVAAQFADLTQGPGLEAFEQALLAHGFHELHEAGSGQSGVAAGMWVLQGGSPEEVRQRGQGVTLLPLHPDLERPHAPGNEGKGEPSEAEGAEAGSAAQQAPAAPQAEPLRRSRRRTLEQELEEEEQRKRQRQEALSQYGLLGGTLGQLGPNMLWNVLHRLRKPKGEGALEEAEWNRVAILAVLALVGITLLVLLLVNL